MPKRDRSSQGELVTDSSFPPPSGSTPNGTETLLKAPQVRSFISLLGRVGGDLRHRNAFIVKEHTPMSLSTMRSTSAFPHPSMLCIMKATDGSPQVRLGQKRWIGRRITPRSSQTRRRLVFIENKWNGQTWAAGLVDYSWLSPRSFRIRSC